MRDGRGHFCTASCINLSANTPINKRFEMAVHDGIANVRGIRFRNVSSKHGGSFRLTVNVVESNLPTFCIYGCTSNPITIASSRLLGKLRQKVNAKSNLSMLHGIGETYSRRLADMFGIRCVEDLANLHGKPSTEIYQITDKIRHDRGTLTPIALFTAIDEAYNVCHPRSKVTNKSVKRKNMSTPHSNTRQKILDASRAKQLDEADVTMSTTYRGLIEDIATIEMMRYHCQKQMQEFLQRGSE